MFTTIVEWLVFLTVVGIIVGTVGSIAYGVLMVVSQDGIVDAAMFVLGTFGSVFFVIAPFIFNGAIPNNNWAILILLTCWTVAPAGCILLSTWALERKK